MDLKLSMGHSEGNGNIAIKVAGITGLEIMKKARLVLLLTPAILILIDGQTAQRFMRNQLRNLSPVFARYP